MNTLNKNIFFTFLLVILISELAFSEEADSDQPIEIEADTMMVEETKNTSTYEGDVVLTQGSLIINADRLIIREDRQGFQHSTSIGNPTTFKQKMKDSDEYIEGKALRIEYDGHMDKIHGPSATRLSRIRLPAKALRSISCLLDTACRTLAKPKRVCQFIYNYYQVPVQ